MAASSAVFAMTFDRDGSLWVGTIGDGLFRIRERSVEHYGRAEGLSGDFVNDLYEDREGILWVTTTNGIDSFRDPRRGHLLKVGRLGERRSSRRAGRQRRHGLGCKRRLARRSSRTARSPRFDGGMASRVTKSTCWKIAPGIYGWEFMTVCTSLRMDVSAVSRTGSPAVWADTRDGRGCRRQYLGRLLRCSRKLIRIRDFQVREEFPASQIPMGRIAADPHGGIWIGPRSGGSLVLFRDGVQKEFPTGSAANLRTNHLAVQADGSVLAAFDDGLVGLRQGQAQRMTTKNGLPCNAVYSFIEDKEKRWWLLAECGIVELPDSELQRWWANPEAVVQTRLYDALDGARPGRFGINSAALSPDGRVWFATGFSSRWWTPPGSHKKRSRRRHTSNLSPLIAK